MNEIGFSVFTRPAILYMVKMQPQPEKPHEKILRAGLVTTFAFDGRHRLSSITENLRYARQWYMYIFNNWHPTADCQQWATDNNERLISTTDTTTYIQTCLYSTNTHTLPCVLVCKCRNCKAFLCYEFGIFKEFRAKTGDRQIPKKIHSFET
jgi:hypothetical protein